MSKIACILTDEQLREQTQIAFADKYSDIHLDVGLMEEGVKRVGELVKEGFEIFISREELPT